jgi:seryl-tRNA synthetase
MPSSESGGIRDQMNQEKERLSKTEKKIQSLRTEIEDLQRRVNDLSREKGDLKKHAATLDEAGDILKKDLSEVAKKVRGMKRQIDGVENRIQNGIDQGIKKGVSNAEEKLDEAWSAYVDIQPLLETEQTRMMVVMNWTLLTIMGMGVALIIMIVLIPFMGEEITGKNLWVGDKDQRKIQRWERRQKLEGEMTEGEYEQYQNLLERAGERMSQK